MPIERQLLIASVLVLVSILASKISTRLGVPALLCFLGIGMLAGSEGVGGIYFDNTELAQSLGVVALAFILFAGGLDTNWSTVRAALWPAFSLATIGVILTTVLVGLFSFFVLKLSLLQGLLIGAIISSTDAAAVFSVLRAQDLKLRGRLASILELESGSNDPMAVFLTIGLTELIVTPDQSPLVLIPLFFQQMFIGALCGLLCGWCAVLVIKRLHLDVEGLYPVLTIALVIFIYGLTATLKGSGFLAVYIAGILLGNHPLRQADSLTRFHDGLAWLMQIAMFLTLGLLVFPSRLRDVMIGGLLIALFQIFVARPASVFISLLLARLGLGEKLFISWVGLRGAVPIVLATFPLLAGAPNASSLFDLVFFIVLASVLLQGTLIPFVARWLKVTVSAV
ncbi:MAG: potassium/proton antiporter [Ktedonobacteraceae bacterium]|nr:potassium/proton antiporter [Ktedonobacteraceae bacterium]